jgi:aromatic-L-amino-acid decarboxylase
MLWATSPACTELETVTVDWLAELFGLPTHFRTDAGGGGVIQDSASSASLLAILAARHRVGGDGPHTVYISDDTHSSLEKAARIVGVTLRVVPVDPVTRAMDPVALERMLDSDSGTPVMVCATVGTTSTAAVDPVEEIGALCRARGVWLHVDAAYAGVAAVCPELRWVNDGVAEYADSYVTNPHKWLLTNFDCTVLWVADRAPLTGALSIEPEYLRNTASSSGAVVDYRDWQIPLGRRFRALKLWAVLRWYGAEGLREHIRTGTALADELAGQVATDPDFVLHEPRTLGLVCFRPLWPSTVDTNAATMALMNDLNASGALYLTHTKVGDHVLLRMAIGGTRTEQRHVQEAWRRIRAERARLVQEPASS